MTFLGDLLKISTSYLALFRDKQYIFNLVFYWHVGQDEEIIRMAKEGEGSQRTNYGLILNTVMITFRDFW